MSKVSVGGWNDWYVHLARMVAMVREMAYMECEVVENLLQIDVVFIISTNTFKMNTGH